MLFAVVNTVLEELLFRGVLYDGVEWQWGWKAAVLVTAAIFGIFHVAGYPPGFVGALMAAIYGLLLGWLRHRTQGLILPILAHVFADATIFGILVRAGAL
jgi:membrane protease YdiL (CAAX protease family)